MTERRSRPRELDFVLLPAEPKATSYLIKVVHQKGRALWQPGKSAEEREKAMRNVYLSTKKKYTAVTEEKLRNVWHNLEHAYFSGTECRYRPKLDFLEAKQQLPPIVDCAVIIDLNPEVEEVLRSQLNILPSTSVNNMPQPSKPMEVEAPAQGVTTATQTGSDPVIEEKRRHISTFCDYVDSRLREFVPDPEQRRRSEKFIIKQIKQQSREYL